MEHKFHFKVHEFLNSLAFSIAKHKVGPNCFYLCVCEFLLLVLKLILKLSYFHSCFEIEMDR